MGHEGQSRVGTTVLGGKLEVIAKLGAGGMGVVYEVRHRHTRHLRALKVLHPHYGHSADVVRRFLREASVAGMLQSPRVVETYDAGVLEDGSAYVLMERLHGSSLAELIGDAGALGPARAARLVIEACEGLEAAHAAGIVHRDLKPENVFVVAARDGSEHVKILDFGISKFTTVERRAIGGGPDDARTQRDPTKLTRDGQLMGTPMYMAPEQLEGAALADARSDVYAMGVVLHECLAGAPPYTAASLPKLLVDIETGDYPALLERVPGLDPALAAVVERAMAREPAERFQTAAELAGALAPFTTGSPAGPVARRIPPTSDAFAETAYASDPEPRLSDVKVSVMTANVGADGVAPDGGALGGPSVVELPVRRTPMVARSIRPR